MIDGAREQKDRSKLVGYFVLWWLAGVVLFSLTVGAFAAVDHLLDVKRGGLEVTLSDAGCMGGFSPAQSPSQTDCARTEWLYIHWWVWALGVLVVGLGIGLVVFGFALINGQVTPESDPEPFQFR
jgi:hypothetical protein